jgi:hypothetical protein
MNELKETKPESSWWTYCWKPAGNIIQKSNELIKALESWSREKALQVLEDIERDVESFQRCSGIRTVRVKGDVSSIKDYLKRKYDFKEAIPLAKNIPTDFIMDIGEEVTDYYETLLSRGKKRIE